MLEKEVASYFHNPRKLFGVVADDEYNLILSFDHQEQRIFSMKDELQGIFSVLKDPEKFKKVFLDEFGNPAWDIDENIDSSIHWNNRIDLCADALYMESQPYYTK